MRNTADGLATSPGTVAIDPTALAPLPFFGVVRAVLVGLFGAWAQSRREHARRVGEQCFEAYVQVHAIITRLESTDADNRVAAAERSFADHDIDSAKERLAEIEVYKKAILTIRAGFFDATVPIDILGPAKVSKATTALQMRPIARIRGKSSRRKTGWSWRCVGRSA